MKKIDYYSILLVEDEYYLRQAIKHIIEENDEVVIEKNDDNKSRSLFRRSKHEKQSPSNQKVNNELDMKVPYNNRLKYEKPNVSENDRKINTDSIDVVKINNNLKEVRNGKQ